MESDNESLAQYREQLQARLDSEKRANDEARPGIIVGDGLVVAGEPDSFGFHVELKQEPPEGARELSEAERQAELHWDYVEKTLQIHCIDQSELDLCAHHYKTAFVHGWKHGQEALK